MAVAWQFRYLRGCCRAGPLNLALVLVMGLSGGVIAAPFGPFPWLGNLRFEPLLFFGSASFFAWMFAGAPT